MMQLASYTKLPIFLIMFCIYMFSMLLTYDIHHKNNIPQNIGDLWTLFIFTVTPKSPSFFHLKKDVENRIRKNTSEKNTGTQIRAMFLWQEFQREKA